MDIFIFWTVTRFEDPTTHHPAVPTLARYDCGQLGDRVVDETAASPGG
jgi:hypothetical protein